MNEHIKDFVKETLLFSFDLPAIAREEYFIMKQKESGYSANSFFLMFVDLVKVLHEKLHENDWRRIKGVEIIHRLYLGNFTNGKLNIYINDADLYQVTETIKSILLKEGLKVEEKYQKTFIKKKTKREILTEAVQKNDGGLQTDEINQLADECGKSRKSLVNLYREIKDDLLKKK